MSDLVGHGSKRKVQSFNLMSQSIYIIASDRCSAFRVFGNRCRLVKDWLGRLTIFLGKLIDFRTVIFRINELITMFGFLHHLNSILLDTFKVHYSRIFRINISFLNNLLSVLFRKSINEPLHLCRSIYELLGLDFCWKSSVFSNILLNGFLIPGLVLVTLQVFSSVDKLVNIFISKFFSNGLGEHIPIFHGEWCQTGHPITDPNVTVIS